jgi:hypothetical protein
VQAHRPLTPPAIQAAIAKARASDHRGVLIIFTSHECSWGERFATVLKDASLSIHLRQYTVVNVVKGDADFSHAAGLYGVNWRTSGLPYVVILTREMHGCLPVKVLLRLKQLDHTAVVHWRLFFCDIISQFRHDATLVDSEYAWVDIAEQREP